MTKRKIQQLEQEKTNAIVAEDFERAACIREELKGLQGAADRTTDTERGHAQRRIQRQDSLAPFESNASSVRAIRGRESTTPGGTNSPKSKRSRGVTTPPVEVVLKTIHEVIEDAARSKFAGMHKVRGYVRHTLSNGKAYTAVIMDQSNLV